MKVEINECPKCNEIGGPHKKMVRNNYGKEYEYLYFAHFVKRDGNKTKIRWCYIENLNKNKDELEDN